ncbi:hypothetical protein GCM10027566_07940 [Arachidicoccus ginsenosidivorans]|jgi:tetratricopeptide (TPR) repeat protein|uniref:Tetratricopeptide repeat protein n=1 Tax=Arachidicoccus ginsenosidivorans TaxID=496057 RepID=A0A5B8VRP1_9BACT|nr:tetratricopeptide repeat protein [Arachidicoccus ginsenosidivorans]QEC73386.1 tetratricopeptide repeat protein [Arachidicoccus ginsenosidivorans]
MAYNQAKSSADLTAFWYKNQKTLLTIVAIIIIAVLGVIAYKAFIQAPKEDRANEQLAVVQAHFQQAAFQPTLDTAAYKAVLNGAGDGTGALGIIKSYGGTPAGNLAKYYAGAAYLHIGDFQNAVKYLKDFSTDQKQVQMMAYGALGDAYSELKQNKEAISSYKKAAATFEDDAVNASEYLFRAGMLSELAGQKNDAIAIYKKLKDEFPNTVKGTQAEKYLNRLEVQTTN